MATADKALQRLVKAQEQLTALGDRREAAMRHRDDALRAAKEAGATYEAIQQATGLSNATVTKALRRQQQ